ncbi:MAG: hypothetical protein LBJ20_04220 [Candidatus Methanoplasma sp.]|jgi:sulfur carrier protein|nr:hypothetical protein [Candidatus Methanoplasma sp.]
MGAKVIINNTEHDVAPGMTAGEAVLSLGMMPNVFIFTVEGRPVPMDAPIADGTLIKAIKVASGG